MRSSAVNATTGGSVTISNMDVTSQSSAGATASYQLSSSGDILTWTASGNSDAGD